MSANAPIATPFCPANTREGDVVLSDSIPHRLVGATIRALNRPEGKEEIVAEVIDAYDTTVLTTEGNTYLDGEFRVVRKAEPDLPAITDQLQGELADITDRHQQAIKQEFFAYATRLRDRAGLTDDQVTEMLHDENFPFMLPDWWQMWVDARRPGS